MRFWLFFARDCRVNAMHVMHFILQDYNLAILLPRVCCFTGRAAQELAFGCERPETVH